ncbi:MAG: hypothetical protein IJV83_02170 [Clostridia bacterium]|nr:hypothetical protein [Clostridia bacterium]
MERYAYRYFGKMENGMQSIPLGNGKIGVNVWISSDGAVHFLLSKGDCWSELYRLLKPAHLVLKTTPNLFAEGAQFALSIADGILTVSNESARLVVYADAFAPCVRLRLTAETPTGVRLDLQNYRNKPIDPADDFSNYFMRGGNAQILESADTVVLTDKGGVAQIHRNQESCYGFSLRNQDMAFYIGEEKDPLLGRTFGAGVYSPQMQPDGDGISGGGLTEMTASCFVATEFTDGEAQFVDLLDGLYERYGDETQEKRKKHAQSWRSFWEKTYVYAEGDEDAESITRAFLYQRYMVRCADRDNAPIKFNGSLFTADQMANAPENYDARRWGAPYWFQNTRLIYWYLLYAGDYQSMLPMLDMYLNMTPIATARCNRHFGHEGMLIPETVSYFGLYANANYGFFDGNGVRKGADGSVLSCGVATNPYIRYHFNGMLELSWMMLRYLELSGDTSRREQIYTFIERTLLFFDKHFDYVDGKLKMYPISSLETWQLCVNDLPDVAGLQVICEALSAPSDIPKVLAELAKKILLALPKVPIKETEKGKVLAPCEYAVDPTPRNTENAELYAVFPFGLYGVGKPDLELARRTYQLRAFRHDGGWSQDPLDAALLGLDEEAERHVVRQSNMRDKRALFPAFWGPNFDETPDQDHGSVTVLSLIFMLLQTDGEEYTAFPAWPKKWNVQFRLPMNCGSYICGEQIDGKRRVWKEETSPTL